jgi:hypothetical protein
MTRQLLNASLSLNTVQISKFIGVSLLAALLIPTSAFAQEAASKIYVAPTDVIEKIKDEGLNHSQVMTTLTYLTETFGPRLTGSPNLRQANDWTKEIMAGRGMDARLEAWGPFGRGWTLKKFTAQMDAPYAMPLVAYPKAWGPSTKGEVTGEVVYFDATTDEDLARFKGKLRNKIVLVGQERKLRSVFEPLAERRTDAQLAEMVATVPTPTPVPVAGPAPVPNAFGPVPSGPATGPNPEAALRRITTTANRWNFLKNEGALVVMDNSSAGNYGDVFVSQAAAPADIPKTPADALKRVPPIIYEKRAEARMVPQLTISSEHWNRLRRLISMGMKPVVSVNIAAQYHDKDPMAYNTIAEIPGTDLKDEVVMLGGHMDSWQGATGATDNACNIATAMEAVRIIQTLGIKPRRTIRVALWTGEEQGLLGSSAYVKAHFGEMKPGATPSEKPTLVKLPEYEKFSAYYNLDNGAGKVRGMYAQGNAAAVPYFSEWLKPFAPLGAGTVTMRNTGSTDHISFDRIGLPGFQFIQDGLDYFQQTHHSTQDVLERVPEEDIKFNSTIMAAFVFQTAMMDEKMPRKEMN